MITKRKINADQYALLLRYGFIGSITSYTSIIESIQNQKKCQAQFCTKWGQNTSYGLASNYRLSDGHGHLSGVVVHDDPGVAESSIERMRQRFQRVLSR